MPYLTYSEYNDFGFSEITEDEFDQLVKRASDAVDSVTRSFYKFNNINEDVEWRREQFKKAVAAQVEYFHETGATTSYGMNEPTHVTIGRTSMTAGSNKNAQTKPQNSFICSEVYLYLKDTGLLYKGIGVL